MFTSQRLVMRAAGLTGWLLLPAITAGIMVSGLFIATALCNAHLFTELLSSRRITTIVALIATIAVLLIVRPLVEVLRQLLENWAGLVVKRKLRQALLAEVESRGPMRFGLGRSGQIQSVITDGVEALEPYFVKYFTQLAVTFVTAITLTGIIATVSPLIAIILLLCGVAIVAIPRIWDRVLAERGQSHWQAYENLNADFVDAMMGMSTLKSFGAAQAHGDKLNRQSRQLLTTTMGQLRLSLGETGLSGMMKVLGPALGLVLSIHLILHNQLPAEKLFMITLLAIEVYRPFTALSASWHEAFFGISALPAMSELFDEVATEPDHLSATPTAQPPRSRFVPGETRAEPGSLITCNSEVLFNDVGYTYPNRTEPALTGVNFSVPSGKTTALVGLSGSGKSTALGLLMGFDSPSEGSITIGGVAAEELHIAQVATLVPQDPIIFPGTVRDILAEANPVADDTEIMRALQLAEATQLHRENDGEAEFSVLDLLITEHAQNLSGGQKQRLAIARALVRHCPLLILDESTSALDSQTESIILKNIRAAYPELTLLIVTHRIDVAAGANHVVVMEDGRALCVGNPSELAKSSNAWSRLVTTQLGVRQ